MVKKLDPEDQRLVDKYKIAALALTVSMAALINETNSIVRARKLRQLQAQFKDVSKGLDEASQKWVDEQIPAIYKKAAKNAQTGENTYTQDFSDRNTITDLSKAATKGFLGATSSAELGLGRLLRSSSDQDAFDRYALGTTASVEGKELRIAMSQNSVGVLYSNGARHGLDTYAEMLIRTFVSNTTNLATINAARSNDVGWLQCSDGPTCGLDGHFDTALANGLVMTPDDAEGNLISHPNCIRTWNPLPDIKNISDAQYLQDQVQSSDNPLQDIPQSNPLAKGFSSRLQARANRLIAFQKKVAS